MKSGSVTLEQALNLAKQLTPLEKIQLIGAQAASLSDVHKLAACAPEEVARVHHLCLKSRFTKNHHIVMPYRWHPHQESRR